MPPAVAAAGLAGLDRVREDDWRRAKLQDLIQRFRHGARRLGLGLLPSETPIQPLLTGSAEAALALADGLYRRGFLAVAIRPPTVPDGTSRLRITLSAAQEPQQVDQLLEAITACLDGR
jgi:8-amino-7-oxononanoate synthase